MLKRYRIIRGRQHARTLGFRTLNADIANTRPGQAYGIYAGWVEAGGQWYRAAIHYGPRPVLGDEQPSLEAHLLDTTLAESPSEVSIQFVQKLREIQNFASTETLVAQIARDVEQAKLILGGV